MVRVVEAQIARFYKVFVEDENNNMTDEQILEKAKAMILEDEANFELEEELDVEDQDIIHLSYLYDLDD